MTIRITPQLAASYAREQLAKQSADLFRVQQEITTGLRVQKPSDDPGATRQSLVQKDRIEKLNTHAASLKQVQSRLSQAEVQLQEASNLLLRARNVALQSLQPASDESEIQVLARELEGILQQLDSVANASDETGYLFSGTAANTKPFPNISSSTGANTYAGTTDNTELHLTGDVRRNALLSGDQVFRSPARGPTVLTGTTGTTTGTGTDTALGIRQLQVVHGTTTYAPGSGVAPGTSSAVGDTVIGSLGTHHLDIVDTSGTGNFGTISLNGRAPVPWTKTDTNLQLTGPTGEVVFVNTAGITAGFSGTVNIESTGTLSIDGGATTTPITFADDQYVKDSRDGSVVFLDTTAITRAGTDQLEFTETADAFAAINNLRQDLLNTRDLSPSDRNAALSRRLADLDAIQNHVLDVIGIESVSQEQLERLSTRTGDLILSEKLELNDTVSADFTAAVIKLQELTNLQQYTIAAVGRTLSTSLLDYLQ